MLMLKINARTAAFSIDTFRTISDVPNSRYLEMTMEKTMKKTLLDASVDASIYAI